MSEYIKDKLLYKKYKKDMLYRDIILLIFAFIILILHFITIICIFIIHYKKEKEDEYYDPYRL